MRSGRVGRWARLVTLACAIAGAFVACSLNPQPIPPGFEKSGAAAPPSASMGDAGTTGNGLEDSNSDTDAGGTRGDASPPTPAVDSGGQHVDVDGGPDSASDAGDDAATDAAFDAPMDALVE